MKAWEMLGESATPDGTDIQLRRRDDEYLILANGKPLMSSRLHGSEEALARLGCSRARALEQPRVLVGGLGMGFTLRAVLDVLPFNAVVTVAELVPAVIEWNRASLAALAGHPLRDPRVRIQATDVGFTLRANPGRFDVVLLDTDNGPAAFTAAENAGLYERAIARLAKLGAKPVEIDFAPFRKAGALLYEGAWVAERLAALKAFIPSYADEMDESVRAIITGATRLSAVDAFEAQYALAASKRAADAEWSRMDVLLMPTAPTQYTVDEVNADPIALNRRLGHYTNFVNLLDYAAIAVPAGFRSDSLPFGVTLVAPSFSDASLAAIADRFHRVDPNAMGGARGVSLPMQSVIGPASTSPSVRSWRTI